MYKGAMISGEEAIGLRLRVERRKNGLTQEELAQEAGTNQAVIQKIENGKSLRPRVIMEIAEVLKVNPAWLQFGDPWAERNVPED
jgi:transcriptional regulator with XRE-family HTH domain